MFRKIFLTGLVLVGISAICPAQNQPKITDRYYQLIETPSAPEK